MDTEVIKGKSRWMGTFHVECVGADGEVKWEEDAPNALLNEGEEFVLDTALRAASFAGPFHIGLLKAAAAAVAETDTMSIMTAGEADATDQPGYSARQAVNRDGTAAGWPTLALDSGDFQATSVQVSWTASGNWAAGVDRMFLTTGASTLASTTGKLVSVASLSTTRTLQNGDTLNVTYNVKLA